MKKLITLIVADLLIAACSNKQNPKEPMAETGRTQRTENLLANLRALCDSAVFMFGHHDDTVYGIGWAFDNDRSDVLSVCGDRPALLSFDLGHLELGDSVNLDGVPFSRMRQEIISHFDRGGMVTLSWHLNNPLTGGTSWVEYTSSEESHEGAVAAVLDGGQKHQLFLSWLDRVADFLNSLVTPYGTHVPVLFRPWHEHTGSWFWWGQQHCTAQQYKALWQLTVSRLREQGVVNALYAYSPGTEADGDPEKYLERYPGDDIIDLMGIDCYCQEGDVANYAANLDRNLATVCAVAKQHHKAAALTETGFECIKTDDWWTATLAPVLSRHPLSYVLVWRNAHDKPGHFFAPYPGHPSASDFVRFYNAPETLFLRDVNALYLQ